MKNKSWWPGEIICKDYREEIMDYKNQPTSVYFPQVLPIRENLYWDFQSYEVDVTDYICFKEGLISCEICYQSF